MRSCRIVLWLVLAGHTGCSSSKNENGSSTENHTTTSSTPTTSSSSSNTKSEGSGGHDSSTSTSSTTSDGSGGGTTDTQSPTWDDNALTVIQSDTTAATLNWLSATDDVAVTAYRIYQDEQLIATVDANQNAYLVNDLSPGQTYLFELEAADAADNWSTDGPKLTFVLTPPDPVEVAPPIDPTTATTVHEAGRFLYEGTEPIQFGVSPDAISPIRAAIVRGRILNELGDPLSGVVVTIVDHSELGNTVSRADGAFDMAINGGGSVTIRYEKSGYLSLERQIRPSWNDYIPSQDVVLTPFDFASTIIEPDNAVTQLAESSITDDSAGERQAVLMFPSSTTAVAKLTDGSSVELSQMTVRATEFTIGENGPSSMPGSLPPQSAYTYAVELSVDEAVELGADSVEFNQSIPFYVDNFLAFPTGTDVPVGYYDRQKNAWVPSESGKVIEILSVLNGAAEIDSNGDGFADSEATLTELGFSQDELEVLATRYSPGQSLWRARITHFTPYDLNFPPSFPSDAVPPTTQPPTDPKLDNPCLQPHASTIECENQVLREEIPIVGTPMALHYQSDRVSGRGSTLRIQLTEDSIAQSMKSVELEVKIAGRSFQESFTPQPNLKAVFTWDRQDVYGRTLQGAQPVTIRIGYTYQPYYDLAARFGQIGQGEPTTIATRTTTTFWQEHQVMLGNSIDTVSQAIGGWTLSPHHLYDPAGKTIYYGKGGQRSADPTTMPRVVTTFAGTGEYCGIDPCDDGVEATKARLASPKRMVVAPDGTVYFLEVGIGIYSITTDGILHAVYGHGADQSDGIDAYNARILFAEDLALGPDGSLYVSLPQENIVRKIDRDGIIQTIAGSGEAGFSGDNGPATLAQLNYPSGLAVAPDGSLYIGDVGNVRIRRVAPDGIIETFAGNGTVCNNYTPCDEGKQASQAQLGYPRSLAIGIDGSVYAATSGFPTTSYSSTDPPEAIYRIHPNGRLQTLSGDGYLEEDNGIPFQEAKLTVDDIEVAQDGSLYYSTVGDYWGLHQVRRVSPNGIVNTVAGAGPRGDSGDNGAATLAQFYFMLRSGGIAVGPDQSLFIADTMNNRIRRVAPSLPSFGNDTISIVSEDGNELYQFDGYGRHVSTVHAHTGGVLFLFTYDSSGRLIQVTDGDGNTTTIERSSTGQPTAIVGPYGHRTGLSADSTGQLTKTEDPAGATHSFEYFEGLLIKHTDPLFNASSFSYDDNGRLLKDTDAVGATKSLSGLTQQSSRTVYFSNALDETTTYQIDSLSTGDVSRTITSPSGLVTQSKAYRDGSSSVVSEDGVSVVHEQGSDPRWGMVAPVDAVSVTTLPSGLTSTTLKQREATLEFSDIPMSLETETETTEVNGQLFVKTFDKESGTWTITSPLGRRTILKMDELGRTTQLQKGNLLPIEYSYDSHGRLVSTTQGNRTSTKSYDEQGNVSSMIDAKGNTTSLVYDAANRPIQTTWGDGSTLVSSYDLLGRLISISPPERGAHQFEYTAVGQLSRYVSASVSEGGIEPVQYTYDAERKLATLVQGNQTISYEYDAAGRLVSSSTGGRSWDTQYNSQTGQITAITGPDGIANSFSLDGSLMTQVQWSGLVNESVDRTFNENFQIKSETIANTTINYAYDEDLFLTQAGEMSLIRDSEHGGVISTTLGNTSEVFEYNSYGEISSRTAKYGDALLYSVTYARDALGRIIELDETILEETNHYAYSYDARGRLTNVTQNNQTIETYSYDGNSNRIFKQSDGISVNSMVDEQDRLLMTGDWSYSYNSNGRLENKFNTITSENTDYEFDATGVLRSVNQSDGVSIEYNVDGNNIRTMKKLDGTVTQILLQIGSLPLAELDGSNNVVSRFIYAEGLTPAYMIRGGSIYRIFSDHLGSPRLVVNVETADVVQQINYDTFGQISLDSNPGFQPFGFAGGLYDVDTKLIRFGARDYDSTTGRFVAPDPLGFAGGNTNLYVYAENNPVNFKDPSGKSPWDNNLQNTNTGSTSGTGTGMGGLLSGMSNIGSMQQMSGQLGEPQTIFTYDLNTPYVVYDPIPPGLINDPFQMQQWLYRAQEHYELISNIERLKHDAIKSCIMR